MERFLFISARRSFWPSPTPPQYFRQDAVFIYIVYLWDDAVLVSLSRLSIGFRAPDIIIITNIMMIDYCFLSIIVAGTPFRH